MTTFLEAPNTTHITTYLLIVSRVVYIRYLGLIFPKASGKRATTYLIPDYICGSRLSPLLGVYGTFNT